MTWENLHYLERPPSQPTGKAPLLLLLHGYGSNESDLFSFANYLPPQYHVISLRAPYDLGPQSYAWYAINFDEVKGRFSDEDQAKSSRDLIYDFILNICDQKQLDSNDVTLLGFSQGAILSHAITFSYPSSILKSIALSGYCNESLLPKEWKNQNFSHLKLYAAHGTDDEVIPVSWAQQSAELLNSIPNLNFEYHEFKMGHGVSQDSFADFMRWMTQS